MHQTNRTREGQRSRVTSCAKINPVFTTIINLVIKMTSTIIITMSRPIICCVLGLWQVIIGSLTDHHQHPPLYHHQDHQHQPPHHHHPYHYQDHQHQHCNHHHNRLLHILIIAE